MEIAHPRSNSTVPRSSDAAAVTVVQCHIHRCSGGCDGDVRRCNCDVAGAVGRCDEQAEAALSLPTRLGCTTSETQTRHTAQRGLIQKCPLADICALPVASIAHADCILWLWTTNAHLPVAFDVLKAWGFEYKTILTWVKQKWASGIGYAGRPSIAFWQYAASRPLS